MYVALASLPDPTGPGALGAPDPNLKARYGLLRVLSLGFGGFAVGLRQRHPALALAAVHAFAAVLRRLALGRSLAGIYARTVDGCGICRHGHIRKTRREQHRGGGSQRRARQFIDLHDWFLNCY